MKKYIMHKKWMLIIGFFVTTITVVTESIFALVMREIIDSISAPTEREILSKLPVYLLYILVMISVSFFNSIIITKYVQKVMFKLKQDLFSNLFGYDIEDFKKKNVGDYVSLFNNDIEMIESDYVTNIFQIYANLLGIILEIIVALFINVRLTILVLVIGFLILLVPAMFSSAIEKRRSELLESYEKMNDCLNNYFVGFSYIKISQIEKNIAKKWEDHNSTVCKEKYRYSYLNNFLNSILKVLSLGVIISILVLGALSVINGSISVGSMVAMIQIYSGVFQQAGELAYKISSFTTVKTVINKLLPYLQKEKYEQNNMQGNIEKIEFRDVFFSYDSEKEMLKKVNITFEKGKSYAIIGDSGAGKSTLIGMILQLICPNKGDILIDGIKYEEMKPIYSQIAYVSQDVFMFSDTLQFNLFLSDNESEKDIKDLLLKFELDKFMDTDFNEMHIREGATNISGGEKQRISIIRELIKEKPILLMDEATSNVNGEMSEKIYNYLLQQKNVMLISILHNYTDGMLDKFDCVIRVRDGNVTCSGNSEYK